MYPAAARVRESLPFQVLTGPPRTAGADRTVEGMDNRSEIRDFLTSRRARITPEQAGLPAWGGSRRVAGLRREEVALLAGLSVDYYTRLERGNARGASDAVLDALARALQLDEAERAHLFDLVRAANAHPAARAPRRPARQQVRPAVQRILDSMTTTPAYVRNGRLDILAANRLGRALYSPVFDSPAQPANPARFLFLDPRGPEFYVDWERQAHDTVAMLRSEAGRNPHDRALSGLIGELSTRSEVPHLVGRAQRALPPHRGQAPAPPGRRRPHPRVRGAGPGRRRGPADQRVHRRARHPVS